MTKTEENTLNEQNKENHLRYIRAKIIHANAYEMALIKGLVQGLGIVGWSDTEYHRPILEEKEAKA